MDQDRRAPDGSDGHGCERVRPPARPTVTVSPSTAATDPDGRDSIDS